MANYKLIMEYDGSRYRGWQRLADSDNTIQGKLETLLSRLLEEEIQVSGSGRTDAGAHALGQVVNFHTRRPTSCEVLLEGLRQYLPEDIGVRSVTQVPERFHSRLNAVSKTYRYRIWNSPEPCVFDRKYVWQIPEKLDAEAMEAAAQAFLGTHDFRSFCANKQLKKSSVRTVFSITLLSSGPELDIVVVGDGFLHHMVRIIVGTLVEIGRGTREGASIPELLDKQDRGLAGITAPAKGLCLMEVAYE